MEIMAIYEHYKSSFRCIMAIYVGWNSAKTAETKHFYESSQRKTKTVFELQRHVSKSFQYEKLAFDDDSRTDILKENMKKQWSQFSPFGAIHGRLVAEPSKQLFSVLAKLRSEHIDAESRSSEASLTTAWIIITPIRIAINWYLKRTWRNRTSNVE